jgi:hypothetical protein
MTTFAVPPAGSSAWRQIHLTPPNAPLYTVGPYCPLDDTQLQERADGFGCPVCSAAWNFHGLAGRWLNEPVHWRPSAVAVSAGNGRWLADDGPAAERRRLDRWTATAIAAGAAIGLGAGAGRWLHSYAPVVPDGLLAALAVVLLAVGAAVYGVVVLLRWLDGRRYAGNVLHGPVEPSDVEVPDGQR